eukprot:scaffold5178_cov364-Prasinococcus_capsulatus_cf.AAC.7
MRELVNEVFPPLDKQAENEIGARDDFDSFLFWRAQPDLQLISDDEDASSDSCRRWCTIYMTRAWVVVLSMPCNLLFDWWFASTLSITALLVRRNQGRLELLLVCPVATIISKIGGAARDDNHNRSTGARRGAYRTGCTRGRTRTSPRRGPAL